MNKIKRTAKKYIKIINKCNLTNAINHLKRMGYDVIFFNTPIGNELIKAYGLEWDTENKKAFTCYEEKALKAVFIDESLHANDKLYLLLHETGHILLKHIGEEQDEHCDMIYAELEADTFAYEVLNHKNTAGKAAVMVISIALSFAFGCILSNTHTIAPAIQTSAAYKSAPIQRTPYIHITETPRPAQSPAVYFNAVPAESTEDVVYVTTSGKKYHRNNCGYVKNKTNITALSIEQAQKTHTSCSVCNP